MGVCCPHDLERFKRQTTMSPIININEVNNEAEGSINYSRLGDFEGKKKKYSRFIRVYQSFGPDACVSVTKCFKTITSFKF